MKKNPKYPWKLSVREKPVFVIRPLQRIFLALPVVGIFFFFGIFFMVDIYQDFFLGIGGIGMVALSVFVVVVLVFFSSRFEFYEDYFRRKYRGSIRQEIRYSEVFEIRFFPFSKTLQDTTIILNARQNGQALPFIIKGNPKNRELDIHLYDWLKTKVETD